MTNFFGINSPTEVNDGYPGAQPVPGAGNQMQGNPNTEPSGTTYTLPGNQNAVQQLTGTQISAGNINTNSVPTNVNTAPGTDSLLAQMSRGQVLMADSTYGQSGFIPQNGGASPQAATPAANITQPVLARVASGLTYPVTGSSQNYTGN
jgi:hypothetical protein